MKKILIQASVLAAAFCAFANPEILKDRANFSKAELFADDAVFSNQALNLETVKAYEENPSSYKDDELFPIATCYMALRAPDKTKALLEKYLSARPGDARAISRYANILAIFGDLENALKQFEKAYSLGDKEAVKFISQILFQTKRADEIQKYLPQIKDFAKTDLGMLNTALAYAYKDPNKIDSALASEVIKNADVEKILKTASADSYVFALNLYMAQKGVWQGEKLVLPATGARIGGHWGMARSLYGQVLQANPKNTYALRGKAVVEFNLGGVMEACELLSKAIKLGSKDAVNDAMELFVVSKNPEVYKKFEKDFEGFDFSLKSRIAMISYAANNDGMEDLFFAALQGAGAKEIFDNAQLSAEIGKVMKKFEKDPRAKDISKKLSK